MQINETPEIIKAEIGSVNLIDPLDQSLQEYEGIGYIEILGKEYQIYWLASGIFSAAVPFAGQGDYSGMEPRKTITVPLSIEAVPSRRDWYRIPEQVSMAMLIILNGQRKGFFEAFNTYRYMGIENLHTPQKLNTPTKHLAFDMRAME
jgi:hypothetical protein